MFRIQEGRDVPASRFNFLRHAGHYQMKAVVRGILCKTIVMAALYVAATGHSVAGQPVGYHKEGVLLDVMALPPGHLANDLAGLSPAARQKALDLLSKLSFPMSDATSSMRVDRRGAIFYQDIVVKPKGPSAQSASPVPAAAAAKIDPAAVFKLHSRPLSNNRVYLNFRGENLVGTVWNETTGAFLLRMKPFSIDADTQNVSQEEADAIAEVWKNVSEDYGIFDIDVTTERPQRFGPTVGHVLITPRIDMQGNELAPEFVGGYGYIDVWGESFDTHYQPSMVYSDVHLNNAKDIGESVSHEIGHNLSLSHDGRTSPQEEYYRGQGTGKTSWAPIMGASFQVNVTQWDKGEYANANNPQDDIAIIAGKLGVIPDDHSNVRDGATPLVVTKGAVLVKPIDLQNKSPANKGVIGSREDVDYFYFDAVEAGTAALTIKPDWAGVFKPNPYRAANLDIRASVYNSSGGLLAQSDPGNDTFARLNMAVAPGRYYLAIEGAGSGLPAMDGYSDYGSTGRYFISGSIRTGVKPRNVAGAKVEHYSAALQDKSSTPAARP